MDITILILTIVVISLITIGLTKDEIRRKQMKILGRIVAVLILLGLAVASVIVDLDSITSQQGMLAGGGLLAALVIMFRKQLTEAFHIDDQDEL